MMIKNEEKMEDSGRKKQNKTTRLYKHQRWLTTVKSEPHIQHVC